VPGEGEAGQEGERIGDQQPIGLGIAGEVESVGGGAGGGGGHAGIVRPASSDRAQRRSSRALVSIAPSTRSMMVAIFSTSVGWVLTRIALAAWAVVYVSVSTRYVNRFASRSLPTT